MNTPAKAPSGPPHGEQPLAVLAARVVAALERRSGVAAGVLTVAAVACSAVLANRKLFWFDELFTVAIARVRDPSAQWAALMGGVDFNPPLLYALTGLCTRALGESEVAARLPAVVGFSVAGLCLFRFVSARTTVAGGLVALLFPLVTGAAGYAYEARGYGALLGFAALALVCWQGAVMRAAQRGWWLGGVSLALACAALTHAYGVLAFAPIALGEATRALRLGRLEPGVWVALLVASAGVAPSFALLAALANLGTPEFFAPSVDKLGDAYRFFFEPAAWVLAAGLGLGLLSRSRSRDDSGAKASGLLAHEWVSLAAFAAAPLLAFIAAEVTGAHFLARYGVVCVIGVASALGAALANRPLAAVGVLLVLLGQWGANVVGLLGDDEVLEPSSHTFISTSRTDFDVRYAMMAEGDPTLPIVLLDHLDFAATLHYAPPPVAERLMYLPSAPGEIAGVGYQKLIACCGAPGRVVQLTSLLSRHPRFIVFGSPGAKPQLDRLVRAGVVVHLELASRTHFLATATAPSP